MNFVRKTVQISDGEKDSNVRSRYNIIMRDISDFVILSGTGIAVLLFSVTAVGDFVPDTLTCPASSPKSNNKPADDFEVAGSETESLYIFSESPSSQ